MAYEWPTDVVNDADILSPGRFNEDLGNIAEVLNELDAHNLEAASFAASATFDSAAVGRIYWAVKTVNPAFGDSTSYGYPSKTATDIYQVQNNSQWQDLPYATVTTAATGNSVFRIDAFVQYIWFDWLGTSAKTSYDHVSHSSTAYPESSLPCSFQVAIVVDGTLIESSISGHLSLRHRDFWPVKANPERNSAGGTSLTQPGPASPRTPRIFGMGPECAGVVIQAAVEVPPGAHTIKLVVRRPMPPQSGGRLRTGTNVDEVYVYNRVIVAEEAPIWAPTSSVAAVVGVDTFDTETVLSTTSIYTDRLNVLRTAQNDIRAQNIKKHSLRYEHLPSILLNAATANINPASVQTTTNYYPGYTNVFAALKTADNGWWLVDDGAGNDLATSTTFTISPTITSFVRIRAHLHVSAIEDSTGAYLYAKGFFGAFALGIHNGTGWALIPSSITFLNSWNICSNGSGNPEETNVSLLGILDYHNTPGNFNLTKIGVFACGMPNADYAGVAPPYLRANVRWKQGAITAVQLRP